MDVHTKKVGICTKNIGYSRVLMDWSLDAQIAVESQRFQIAALCKPKAEKCPQKSIKISQITIFLDVLMAFLEIS